MNYKNIFFSLFLFLIGLALCAQNPLNPGWLWAKKGGSSASLLGSFDHKMERIVDIAVDNDNNYYYLAEVGGYTFTIGEMVFDTYNDHSKYSDIIIFSTDDQGNFRWSKTIGGGDRDRAISLGLDNEGNVYVSGNTFNWPQNTAVPTPVHFDIDSIMPEATITPSAANKKIFIIKYDKDGNFQWLVQPEGNETRLSYSGVMLKMIIEPNGTSHSLIALTEGSYFDGQLIVPPMDTIGYSLPSQSIIVRYNSAGEFQNYTMIDMKPLIGYYNYQLAYDANLDRYYIADTYRDTPNPENPLSINGYGIESGINKAFYIAAVNNEGEVVWYRENQVIGSYKTGDLILDDMGNIYFSGYAAGVDTIAGFLFNPIGTGSGAQDPFLLKLDSDGNLLWGTNAQLYSPFNGQSIVIDGDNVYLGLGMLKNKWGELEIPGPTGQGLVPDIQIIRFDAQTGEALEIIQNNLVTPTKDAIMAMALDTNGALVVGGYFGSTLFGGTDLQIQNNGPDSDFFIAKYQPQDTGVGIDEVLVLNSIKVYPNPTKGVLYLQSETVLHSYSLYDLQGRIIKQNNLSSNKIDLSELESGVYVIRVLDFNGVVHNFKVVKE